MQAANHDLHTEHPNDVILRDIRTRMADHAELLHYLPVDSVRIEHLSDGRPRKTHPYRIHFGNLQGDESTGEPVDILLSKSDKEGPPKLKYMVSTIHGNEKGYVSVAEAIESAKPARAFEGIVEADGMDRLKLRAVARYYFIAKKIELPSSWPLDGMFIKELISACKVAEFNAGKHAGASRKSEGLTTELASRISAQPHGGIPDVQQTFQDRYRDTYEARWMDSISRDGGRRSTHAKQRVDSQVYQEHEADTEAYMDQDKENIQQSGLANQHANPLRDTTNVRRSIVAYHKSVGLAQDFHLLAGASRASYTPPGLPVRGNSLASLTPRLESHSVTSAESFLMPIS
jgi:hypothetical protein